MFKTVAESAANVAVFESLLETMLMVSISLIVTVPAVKSLTVRVTESAVPSTAAAAKPKVAPTAAPLTLSTKPEADWMLLNFVAAVVEPVTSMEVTAAALARDKVPVFDEVTTSFSILDRVGAYVAVPDIVMYAVSVPAPPDKTSDEPSVCRPVALKAPSKMSLPDLPVKLSALVVSEWVGLL